jgi:hypothetical protein
MGEALVQISKNANLSFEGVSMQVYHPLVRGRVRVYVYEVCERACGSDQMTDSWQHVISIS